MKVIQVKNNQGAKFYFNGKATNNLSHDRAKAKRFDNEEEAERCADAVFQMKGILGFSVEVINAAK